MESMFRNPKLVKEQLDLPAVINYSFVGLSSPHYHAKLEAIIVRIAGETNIRKRTFKESSGGRYTAYRYAVYHDVFDDVEAIYAEVAELAGTKFVI